MVTGNLPDEQTLQAEIAKLLDLLGFYTGTKGYSYIFHAILLSVRNRDLLNDITEGLYQQIATHFSTTSSNVEHAMKLAIELVIKKGNFDELSKLFPQLDASKKLTNSNVICRIADDILVRYGSITALYLADMDSINDEMFLQCQQLTVKITDCLHRLRIPANIRGFEYIRFAVFIAVYDVSILEEITKRLYVEVGKKFNTPSTAVERAIRHANWRSWDTKNPEAEMMFVWDIPKNSALIARIVDDMRIECKVS
jgi:hypothetical protein